MKDSIRQKHRSEKDFHKKLRKKRIFPIAPCCDIVYHAHKMYDVTSLPDDPDQLKSIIISLSQSNARQQETLDQLVAEVSRLNVYIEQLLEMIFGKKSEKQSKEKSDDESKNESTSPETSENADSNEGRKKRKKNGGGQR